MNVIPFPTTLREPVVQPSVEHPEWGGIGPMAAVRASTARLHRIIRAERVVGGVHARAACGRRGMLVRDAGGLGGYCKACQRLGWRPPEPEPDLLQAS